MEDLVSVLILSYRNLEGIYESLKSVFKQKYENIEIVISDDGTVGFESEKNKIEEFVEKNRTPNIREVIINDIKVNGGTVKNINSAIKKSNGIYIKVLSAEDVFSDEKSLGEYVEYLKNNDYDICFSKIRGVKEDGTYQYELLACESDYKKLAGYSVEEHRKRLFSRNYLPGIGWAAKRQLFEKYGYFREESRIIEDYPYWLHLTEHGCKFGFLDKYLIDYKLTGVSSAGSYSEMFMNDMFVIYDKFIFPYDHRYGVLQPIYNFLKKSGLNFYMAKARWGKKNALQRFGCRIKYLPFFVYTSMQNRSIDRINKERKHNAG